LQVLDIVKLGELAAVIGRDELLEFFQGLVAEVAAVDEEKDAARYDSLPSAHCLNPIFGLSGPGGRLGGSMMSITR
jgi:hypothetical protein